MGLTSVRVASADRPDIETRRHGPDYIDRTIATVRNHRDADNCWPQWANIFADEIEDLRVRVETLEAALRDAEPLCARATACGAVIAALSLGDGGERCAPSPPQKNDSYLAPHSEFTIEREYVRCPHYPYPCPPDCTREGER